MKNNLVRLPFLIIAALLLSSCGPYQLLPDDDPNAPHHTWQNAPPQQDQDRDMA